MLKYLVEIKAPTVTSSGQLVSHSYDLPSGNHKMHFMYKKINAPDRRTNTWIVDYGRKTKNKSGKFGSMTYSRSGMSKMDTSDRIYAIRSVSHSIDTFIDSNSPHKIMGEGNTKKKREFNKTIGQRILDKYNKKNNYGDNHPHRAHLDKSGNMVFPANNPERK